MLHETCLVEFVSCLERMLHEIVETTTKIMYLGRLGQLLLCVYKLCRQFTYKDRHTSAQTHLELVIIHCALSSQTRIPVDLPSPFTITHALKDYTGPTERFTQQLHYSQNLLICLFCVSYLVC